MSTELNRGTTGNKSSWQSKRNLNSGPPCYKSGAPSARPTLAPKSNIGRDWNALA